LKVADEAEAIAGALDWAAKQDSTEPLLFHSSQDPEQIGVIQDRLGRDESGAMVERIHAGIARGLVEAGVGQLIVAGGETSGAVVQALGITALRIGPEIDPGVPWTVTVGDAEMALALKSGNFGSQDFFEKAFGMLS
jgi:3-dehydrotetronate 4-kinase